MGCQASLRGCILLLLALALHPSFAAAAISLSHVDGRGCTQAANNQPHCAPASRITIHGSAFHTLTPTPTTPTSPAPPQAPPAPAYYNTTIDNVNPRRTVQRDILDAHDGNILLYNGTYYYYGAAYGPCLEPNGTSGCAGVVWGESCGWLLNHNVSLYTSVDLQHWEAHAAVFEIARDFDVPAVLFSPKVIYNARTKMFVLWFNYNPKGSLGLYGTATSPSPYGPFKVQVAPVTTLVNKGPSDSALWADEATGDGYFIYSGAFMVSVERMTDDYLQTQGAANSSGQVGAYNVEAPAFFYRNGRYHVSTGHLCCYCKEGAMATVYVASHPLGPYTFSANLSAAIPAQQTDIMRYVDRHATHQLLYRGDRWQQSPDGSKAHDPTAMAHIEFDEDGVVRPLEWLDRFNITVLALGPGLGSIGLAGVGWRVVVVGGGGRVDECSDVVVLDEERLSCWLPSSGGDVEAVRWLMLQDGAGRPLSTAVEVVSLTGGRRVESE